MTTLIAPVRDIRYELVEPLMLLDRMRHILLPDNVLFYIEGASLEARLTGVHLLFTLENHGHTLVFLGSDDPMYFAQLDSLVWIEMAVQALLAGAKNSRTVYIEGQLSGTPKALLMAQAKLMPDCSDTEYAVGGTVHGQMTCGHHAGHLSMQQAA